MNANVAADWPDWSGETAIIIATGPSASFDPLEPLRGRVRAIAIKTSWLLAPWVDALYGTDKDWWIANQGAPKFTGLKFCPSPSACRVYRLRPIVLKQRAEILIGEIGVVGCGSRTGGGHSGFQAINLAVQFGATRIVLIGFDMTLASGAHWHRDGLAFRKPDAKAMASRRETLDACARQFEMLGVEVLNASPKSALTAYRKVDFHELAHLLSLSPAARRGHPVGGVRHRVAS